MKSYPRIFSLSTLGLIHHQEFDYRFHEFRTDFVGESGAGKSMIADLLQLIFVGSDAFESATKATGERKPSGMVLEESGRGRTNSIGYAFLNIEVDVQKFLVVGTCIETGNRSTHSFIIQNGFGYDPIMPLKQPLAYADFLNEDQILPIDLLKDHMLERNMFCESWIKPKKFHEILFKENILPMDLASGDRLLKDYASILQSFSRGKTLDTQKSSSIKDFLFGHEKAIGFYEKFKQAVHDMEATIGEYGNNIEEIKRIAKKHQALIGLREKMQERDALHLEYLSKRIAYLTQEYDADLGRLEDIFEQYLYTINKVPEIKAIINSGILEAESNLPVMNKRIEEIESDLSDLSTAHKGMLFIQAKLITLQCDLNKFKEIHTENLLMVSNKRVLNDGLEKLSSAGVLHLFKEIIGNEKSEFLSTLESRLKSNADVLAQKQLLSHYLDIDNPQSLAHWALLQKRSFSIEEESIILSFQKLPRIKPHDKKDYLPVPEVLFSELSIAEMEEEGFWLDLSGIRRFVQYVDKQILDVYDPAKIRLFFEEISKSTTESIIDLSKKVSDLENLKSTFLSMASPHALLIAYEDKEKIQEYKTIDDLKQSSEELAIMFGHFENKESILAKFGSLSDEKQVLVEDIFRAKNYKKEVEDMLSMIKGFTENLEFVQESSNIISYSAVREHQIEAWAYDNVNPEFSTIRMDLGKITRAVQRVNDWEEKNTAFIATEKELEELQQELKLKFSGLSPIEEARGKLVDPKAANTAYINAEQAYILFYKKIIEDYIPSESYKLFGDESFLSLSKSLLPEAFADLVASEADPDAIEVIKRYLMRINDKNRQLNDRKIQKIRDLLDDVDHEITEQMEVVRRIDNFLKTGHNITGGYHARLKRSFSTSFPKEWMDVFRQKVEKEVGIFVPEDGLVDKLSKRVGLSEMMIDAFQICGGSKSQDIKVSKLLDPSSYYELSFTMESDGGRINKGSTGQTYAAIALLCIARLSVMSREEGKNQNRAVRVMPIDEAEGLGSNYDMLYDIAREFDYQIISLSINPVGKFNEKDQYIYMLHKNMEVDAPVNYRPIGIFCDSDIKNAI